MIKLLIVADDFTGALDTGVQFAPHGAVVRVSTNLSGNFSQLNDDTQVLILDAETRHMQPKQAYEVIHRITKDALDAGIPYFYKKTDSVLRGNIGSELSALLNASGVKELPFIPAFPQMERITRGGIHYVGDKPVSESVFGRDPYHPVVTSSVKEIIASQTTTPVATTSAEAPTDTPFIRVYDAETQSDLQQIAQSLHTKTLWASSGCAGFATELPAVLGLQGNAATMPQLTPGLFVICGSVNPVTRKQLDMAESNGFSRFHLESKQKLDPAWLDSPESSQSVATWLAAFEKNPCCILDSLSVSGKRDSSQDSDGLSAEQIRSRIGVTMGTLTRRLLDSGLDTTLMCTGGDTLLALMRSIDVNELVPVCEIASGSVLTSFEYNGKRYNIITKSGGFGKPDLLLELARRTGTLVNTA